MGIDFNQKGIAWTITKPDGNRKITYNKDNNSNPLNKLTKTVHQGFIPWELQAKSTNQSKCIVENTCHKIINIALKHDVGIAIENLDFSQKKTELKSGYINKKYNHMLSSLNTSKFVEFISRLTDKKFINLYLVNPTYSSVGGFTKYGLINHVKPDIAASHWLARQALFGQEFNKPNYKNFNNKNISKNPNKIIDEETNIIKIKLNRERITLPYLSKVAKQSKTYQDGLKWGDISKALGKYRKHWCKNLHQYNQDLTKAGKQQIMIDRELSLSIINPFE